MRGINIYDLYLPPKVIALLLTIILGGGTVYGTYKLVYGRVTITSPQPNAYIIEKQALDPLAVPATLRMKPGRRTFVVAAPEYIGKDVGVVIIPFWHKQVNVNLEKDLSFENDRFKIEYQYDVQNYLIVPKIPFGGAESPQSNFAANWGSYEAYAKEAIRYIKLQGVDPASLNIEWWGREYWPKGKRINY